MNIPSPQALKNSLRDELNEFVYGTKFTNSYKKVTFTRLMAECEALQKTDVIQASLLRAFLYSSVGDFKETDRMLRNAELNGGVNEARIERFTHCANHGFASEGLSLIDGVFKNRNGKTLMELARGAIALGAFNKIVKAVQASLRNNEVLNMTGLHELACRAAGVMGKLGVSDVQLAAMLDVAGESLRKNRLLWETGQPDVTVLDTDQGGPALAFEYRVHVSPGNAALMTWELTESLVARELDLPNVVVGFLGTNLQVSKPV